MGGVAKRVAQRGVRQGKTSYTKGQHRNKRKTRETTWKETLEGELRAGAWEDSCISELSRRMFKLVPSASNLRWGHKRREGVKEVRKDSLRMFQHQWTVPIRSWRNRSEVRNIVPEEIRRWRVRASPGKGVGVGATGREVEYLIE